MSKETGGSIFPEIKIESEFSSDGLSHLRSIHRAQSNMTLRDYMAIHASEKDIDAQLGGIPLVDIVMVTPYGTKSVAQNLPLNARQIARYMHADAMLKEREK